MSRSLKNIFSATTSRHKALKHTTQPFTFHSAETKVWEVTAQDAAGERLSQDPEAGFQVQVRGMTSLVVPVCELGTRAGPETVLQKAPPRPVPPRRNRESCSPDGAQPSPGS